MPKKSESDKKVRMKEDDTFESACNCFKQEEKNEKSKSAQNFADMCEAYRKFETFRRLKDFDKKDDDKICLDESFDRRKPEEVKRYVGFFERFSRAAIASEDVPISHLKQLIYREKNFRKSFDNDGNRLDLFWKTYSNEENLLKKLEEDIEQTTEKRSKL